MNNNTVPFVDKIENNYWELCKCLAEAVSDDLIFEEDALPIMRKMCGEIWNVAERFEDCGGDTWKNKHNDARKQYPQDSLIWKLSEPPAKAEYPLSTKSRIRMIDDNFIILLGCLYLFGCHDVIEHRELERYIEDFTRKELEYISNSDLNYEDAEEIMKEHLDKFNTFTRAMYEDENEGRYNVALDVV